MVHDHTVLLTNILLLASLIQELWRVHLNKSEKCFYDQADDLLVFNIGLSFVIFSDGFHCQMTNSAKLNFLLNE